MTDRQLIQLAATLLTDLEFRVWFTKFYADHGRRTGSLALGITEAAWRYHIRNAQEKLAPYLDPRLQAGTSSNTTAHIRIEPEEAA